MFPPEQSSKYDAPEELHALIGERAGVEEGIEAETHGQWRELSSWGSAEGVREK